MGKNNKSKSNRFKEKSYDEGDTIRKLELLAEKKGLPIWQLNPNDIESFSEESENDNLYESSEEDKKQPEKLEVDNINNKSSDNKDNKSNETNDDNDKNDFNDKKNKEDSDEEIITTMTTPDKNYQNDHIEESKNKYEKIMRYIY